MTHFPEHELPKYHETMYTRIQQYLERPGVISIHMVIRVPAPHDAVPRTFRHKKDLEDLALFEVAENVCSVCWQDQLAGPAHSREAFTVGIEKVKMKQPTAHLTVEDLSSSGSKMDLNDEKRVSIRLGNRGQR